MKKILIQDYGSVDVLYDVDEPIPTLEPNQILVKMVATSVNDVDLVVRGHGPASTMPPEFRLELPHMLGQDFSGIIVRIGDAVTKFRVGDHVIGLSPKGTYSEYITVDENSFVAKVPSDLDLIPLGGLYVVSITAWSAVITNGQVQAGQKVLVHGGAGGVGSMAVQIAKNAGAYVIATASADSRDYLTELGADEVIDYKAVDFSDVIHDIDLVVNTTGLATLEKSFKVVKATGKICSTNGVPDPQKAAALGIDAKYIRGDLTPTTLNSIINLYNNNKLKVYISKLYHFTLNDIKAAHRDFEAGPNRGIRIISFDAL
jgi:NADPH:quinone reductase-like Zn-dependent oxidoreductase